MTKRILILLGFIVLKFVLQYALISSDYDLQRDEYLHLDQAHHLAWGFLSVPPLTSWISYLIYLLGNTFFWIKFFPALFGALTIAVVWKAIEALNGNLFALILGATCVLFSALLRLNILYQPNSFDVLSWTAVYFMLLQYVKTHQTKWLFIGAACFALGILNKYNIVFLMVGLLPALIISKQRKMFTQPSFYGAVVLGLLIVMPNLLWQYHHDFPVVHHLNELAETQLIHVNSVDFLKSQLLFYMGAWFVIFAALYAVLFYGPFKQYGFFFFSMAFTLAAFIYFKAKDYYSIGIYPIYIAFGAVYVAEVLKTGWKRYLQPIALAIPILLFVPFYNVGFPNKSPQYIVQNSKMYKDFGLLRWEDGRDHALPQDFADMLGWKALAKTVDSINCTLPKGEHTLILCDNYGQAGAINYYAKSVARKAVSFNADYINWLDLTVKIDNLIRVKEFEDSKEEMSITKPFFDTAFVAGSVDNALAREFGTTIFVFTGARIDINQRLKAEIAENKKR